MARARETVNPGRHDADRVSPRMVSRQRSALEIHAGAACRHMPAGSSTQPDRRACWRTLRPVGSTGRLLVYRRSRLGRVLRKQPHNPAAADVCDGSAKPDTKGVRDPLLVPNLSAGVEEVRRRTAAGATSQAPQEAEMAPFAAGCQVPVPARQCGSGSYPTVRVRVRGVDTPGAPPVAVRRVLGCGRDGSGGVG